MPQKIKTKTTCDPAIPLPGIYHMCTKTNLKKKIYALPMFTHVKFLRHLQELDSRIYMNTKTTGTQESPTVSLIWSSHPWIQTDLHCHGHYVLFVEKKKHVEVNLAAVRAILFRVNWINDHVIIIIAGRVQFFGPRTAGLAPQVPHPWVSQTKECGGVVISFSRKDLQLSRMLKTAASWWTGMG